MFDSKMQRPQDLKAIAERQQDLTARLARLATVDGAHPTAFPSLTLVRGSVPTACTATVCQPSLGFVVQGRKRALLNEEVFYYDALNYLVVSVTLPMMGQVLEATSERPFLCLRMDLDLEEIGRLLLELGDRGEAPVAADRGLFVARMDESLLDAVLRMVKLLDTPSTIACCAANSVSAWWISPSATAAIIASSAPSNGSSNTSRSRCASRSWPKRCT